MLKKLVDSMTTSKSLFTAKTQFDGVSKRARKQQLVIGLDFGTAYSKVVIGEVRQAHAVHFAKFGSRDNPYLLPATFSVNESGVCTLDLEAPGTAPVNDLKMRILQGDYSLESKAACIVYIALMLRYVRKWLFSKHKRVYGGNYLDWNLNVGLPAHNYHDDDLVKTYREIVEFAWLASVSPGDVSFQLARDCLSETVDTKSTIGEIISSDAIELFPEFAAQITGYVRSPQRQEDLHALMDVGAGTVDVTVFNIFNHKGEDRFPVFAKSVENLGVHFHTLHRLKVLKFSGRWKPLAQDKALSKREFARKVHCTLRDLAEADRPFRHKISDQLISQLKYTKEKRYPLSRHWTSGIPLFLCGGGANVDFYTEIIDLLEESGKPYRIVRQRLPKPERLKANRLRSGEYDRLSVAYGLSFDAFDIGEIERAGDIEDISLPGSAGAGIKIICPRCRGTGGPRGNDCLNCGGSGMTWTSNDRSLA